MADRDNQTTADLELGLQGRRDLRSAGRNQDGVELAAIRPTLRSVAMFQFDIPVSEPAETFARLGDQRGMSLDGADLSGDLRRDGRGVARTGAEGSIGRLLTARFAIV